MAQWVIARMGTPMLRFDRRSKPVRNLGDAGDSPKFLSPKDSLAYCQTSGASLTRNGDSLKKNVDSQILHHYKSNFDRLLI